CRTQWHIRPAGSSRVWQVIRHVSGSVRGLFLLYERGDVVDGWGLRLSSFSGRGFAATLTTIISVPEDGMLYPTSPAGSRSWGLLNFLVGPIERTRIAPVA